MNISFNWLSEYIDIPKDVKEITKVLTSTGLEVEGLKKIDGIKGGLNGLVIGKISHVTNHPNADKLKLTAVEIGAEQPLSIVCGAPNVAEGQSVIVAKIGSTLYPINGEPFKIKKSKIRGEISEGMICAEDEIGISSNHDGIIVLDADLRPGSPASEYYKYEDDHLIEIGLTPNRADATSHIGVARDLRPIYHQPIKWPQINDFKVENNNFPIEVNVENSEACPRYSGLTISNITIADSPDWLQARLKTIGLKPINNIVDITNYVLHEVGQPLHAFDAELIKGAKINVKTLSAKSTFVTLDGEERILSDDDLMICDNDEGMCIAGVLGGLKSGVTKSTTSIFLEAAYFSPEYVRRTAQYHQIKTDASFRFERGTDPNITVYALKRAAQLITEISGGNVSSEMIDIYPQPITDFRVPVQKKNINRLIGKEISLDEVRTTLNELDIEVENENEISFVARVPPYRVDVSREADIIEEVLRIHGFDNVDLPSSFGADFLAEFPQKDNNSQQQKLTSYLVDNGFYEILTNSLTKPGYVELVADLNKNNSVEILNKLSEDLGVMRQTLLFSGLEIIAYNLNRKQKDLKIFEFGNIYQLKKNDYYEENHLGCLMSGLVENPSWTDDAKSIAFHDISGVVSNVLGKLNIRDYGISNTKVTMFEYGLSLTSKNKILVQYGKIKRSISAHFGIKQEIFYADFNWDLLLSETNDNIVIERVSRFPEVRRDLSLVINKEVQFKEIEELSFKTEGKLIKSIEVFDIYEGENLDKNKKAYSIKFILESKEKTLTDKVIDKAMNKLMNTFKSDLGALIRQ